MNFFQEIPDTKTKIGITIGLFVIALLPRVLGLGLFLTSDEPLWLTRSVYFSESLLTRNLADTLQTGHPGVTTMWTGSLGLGMAYLLQSPDSSLLEFIQTLPHESDRVDITLVPWARLPLVLLSAAFVALFYRLGSRLIGSRIALVAALLLAFDPLFLAHSRTLHHDALATIFMSLSVLMLLNFFLATSSSKSGKLYLVGSGIVAGLALLSKGTALALIAFAGLFFMWLWLGKKWPFRVILFAGLSWLGLAVGTFVVLWPAMWVIPGQVLTEVFGWIIVSTESDNVADTNAFSWAGQVPELGILFYPVNWLLKSTPLAIVGLIALIGWWRAPQNQPRRWVIAWLGIFALLFTVLLTLGDKRDGRYLLPIYPGGWLLAAAGLTWLADRILKMSLFSPRLAKIGLVVVFVVLLVAFSLPWYPYYHTYYNPVIGGNWLAPRLIKVGWGEGMEQAAAFLAQESEADQLVVATSYAQNFLPFFEGKSIKHHASESSDYVLNYIRQIQNGYPFPEYWQYYQARDPVYQLKLGGIDYLWLYQESALARVRNTNLDNDLELMGFTLDSHLIEPDQTVTVTLVWRVPPDKSHGRIAHLQLIDSGDKVWGNAEPAPILDPAGPSQVEGHYELKVSPAAPRFDGQLKLSVTDVKGQPSDPVTFGQVMVRNASLPPAAKMTPVRNLDNQISLVGYRINNDEFRPGDMLEVTLYWQAQSPIIFDYTVFTQLQTTESAIKGQHDSQPVNGQLPTSQWTVGEVVADTHTLMVAPDAEPGDYRLLVGMYRWDTGERLPVMDENNQASGTSINLESNTSNIRIVAN